MRRESASGLVRSSRRRFHPARRRTSVEVVSWDATRYDEAFSFVPAMGAAVLDLLDPLPGERVLDLGCGSGELTAQIAARGAHVVGVDASPEMVARARERFPGLDVRLADAEQLQHRRARSTRSSPTPHCTG